MSKFLQCQSETLKTTRVHAHGQESNEFQDGINFYVAMHLFCGHHQWQFRYNIEAFIAELAQTFDIAGGCSILYHCSMHSDT